ncbi:ABC transporter substrate-binding protein [Micromonospora echinofusca]|uniref:Extracellular solute-binding protein n=1 Tax=Micromonospora echinofusca TaxID=47858 RepID=A0ABS3VR57_MICEH|nr:sugar ABC transporter substrate-binding protein [Micromonospora echinofusca]MBO4207005.1 extracellular solute-binding protein [Micromonospora echinofusca]
MSTEPLPRLRRRRIGAALLAAGLAVAGLTACADEEKPGGPTSLTLTIWGNANDKTVMDQRLALAKKALPEIDVKLVQISEEYNTKVQTMFAGGKAPDVLMLSEEINVYSSKGQLEDLTPHLKKANVDPVARFGQGPVDTYSTDGKLWAAPDRGGAMVLYYNKAIFDAQGVAYPDGTWDWAKFREAAQKLTVREGGKVKSWGYAAGDWWPWLLTWMYQNGGSVLDAAGKPVANSPANVEAIQFYNDLVLKDRSAPSPIDYANAGLSNGQPDALFAQGKLAMGTTGFWNIASLKDSKLKWDIAPLWQGKQKAVPAFGSGLAVSSQSKHKDAAARLVAFLTSAEGQAPIVTSGLDVPSNLEVVNSDAFKKPAWNTTGVNLAAFTESASAIYSPPLVPEWNEIQKAYTDEMAPVWNGKDSVQAGLDRVQKSLERILS